MKKLLLLFLLVSGLSKAQTLDQFNTGVSNSFETIDTGQFISQGIISGLTGSLTRFDLEIEIPSCNSGLTAMTYTCVVFDSTGTIELTSQSSSFTAPSSRVFQSVIFSTPINVNAGSTYYIQMRITPQICDTTTQSFGVINWYRADNDSSYSNGIGIVGAFPAAGDMYFKTYVDTASGNPCQNPINASAYVVSGASCGNSDANLSVSVSGGDGSYFFSWSPSGGTAQTTGPNLPVGMYTVTVSDTSGCSAQSSVYAYAASQVYPTINVSSYITCTTSGSLYSNPSGGAGGYTYLWSTGATTQSISGILNPGSYTVTVMDSTGCSGTDSIFVNDQRLQVTVNAYNATCGNNNGYIYANAQYGSGVSYSWSGPSGYNSTSQNIFNLVPGMYTLMVSDTVCPAVYDTLIISASSFYTFSTTINNHISCAGRQDGSATITVTGGNPLIMWSNVNNVFFNATGTTVSNLPLGLNIATLNDSLGCYATDSILITEPPMLMDSISFTEPSCGLNNGNISTNVTGGTAPYSYFWNTGNTSNNLNGIVAGIYMVDVTDANGCIVSDVATIGSAGGPVITQDVHTDITCHGANDGSIAVSISGGTAPYTVFWTDMDSSYTTLTRNNLQAGPYELVVADASGCQTIFSTYVYEPSPISIDVFTSSPTACATPNGSINTSVNGGTAPYVYFWSDASTGSSLNGLMAGVYNLTVTDANGCTAVNEAFLSDPTMLDAYGSNISTNCGTNTGSIDITAYNGWGNYSYQWTNGATTEDISGLYPGNYGVTITDLFDGCVKALEFTVNSSTANYAPEVCLVTVDTLDERNVIVWERPAIGGIKEFVIYRETSQPGVYRYIGTNPIDSLTEMKDTLADADLHTWKYKISAIDSCGVETGVSEIEHRPIYLTVDTNGVGLPSLIWTHYMGRPYSDYIVKRNANGTGWVDVVTLPASQNSFVDLNCPSGTIEYTIEALFTSTCNSTRGAINTTRSNIKSPSSVVVGLKGNTTIENNISLFPNPSQDNFTISLANKAKENVIIEVVNALGQVVYTTTINESSKTTTITAANWNTGVYFVRINSSEMRSVIKFVKQ